MTSVRGLLGRTLFLITARYVAVRSTLRSLDRAHFHYLGKIAHVDERAADGTVTEMI
jgi:hypothetical protein